MEEFFTTSPPSDLRSWSQTHKLPSHRLPCQLLIDGTGGSETREFDGSCGKVVSENREFVKRLLAQAQTTSASAVQCQEQLGLSGSADHPAAATLDIAGQLAAHARPAHEANSSGAFHTVVQDPRNSEVRLPTVRDQEPPSKVSCGFIVGSFFQACQRLVDSLPLFDCSRLAS